MARFVRTLVFFVAVASIAQGQTILMQERFNNGVAENVWLAGFNGSGLMPFQTALAPGDGWVGRLTNQASGGNVAQSSAENKDFSDFMYEATIYIPVDEGFYYGIEFRGDPTGLSAGYQFVAAFNPVGTQRMRFRVRPLGSPSMPTSLKDWTPSEIPGGMPTVGGWHTLAVKAVGPHFWFYFDGKEMPGGLVYDDTFTSGTVGVYLWDMSSPNEELLVDNMKVTSVGTSAVPDASTPDVFTLSEAYPNPVIAAAGQFQIDASFSLMQPADAVLYDALGRALRTLSLRPDVAGRATLSFAAAGLPAGVYTVRVTQGGRMQQRAVVVR
jgi:hypothetical protein